MFQRFQRLHRAAFGLLCLGLFTLNGAHPQSREPEPDAALAPPPVIVNPGPAYAPATRPFQGIPAIACAPGGRLWAAWYGGGPTEGPENYIMLATSADAGHSWSDVQLVIDPPGEVRAFDPALWLDPTGRLWLFWAQGWSHWDGRAGVWAITAPDPDSAAPHWSAPRRLTDGIMMNKPLVRSGGDWLFPISIWETPASAKRMRFDLPDAKGPRVYLSRDRGATLARLGRPVFPGAGPQCDEHMLVERRDGALWMLVRKPYGIGQSLSRDGGRSWSPGSPAGLSRVVSRFFISRLASGNLILVKNSPPKDGAQRSHLTAHLSTDDGATWSSGRLLDERNGVSYPDGVQSPDGVISIIYDYSRTGAKQILLARFTEQDLAAGKPVSKRAALRLLVNQATGAPAPAPPLKLNANAGGSPLPSGPAAVLTGGEPDAFKPGARIFTNRDYTILGAPAALRGARFLRAAIDGAELRCTQSGAVCVLTPSRGRNRDSLEPQFLREGFAKAALPEFVLFGGPNAAANACSLFFKNLKKGETLKLGKWGVALLTGSPAQTRANRRP